MGHQSLTRQVKIELYFIHAKRGWQWTEAGRIWQERTTDYAPVRRNSLYAAILLERAKESGGKFMSLAHCGPYCVCCFGQEPCGIDLEKIRKVAPELIPEGFSKKPFPFLRQWTALESYAKLKGMTLQECSAPAGISADAAFCYLRALPGYLLCISVYRS